MVFEIEIEKVENSELRHAEWSWIFSFSLVTVRSILSIRNRIEGIMVKPNPVYEIILRTSFITSMLKL